MPCRPERWWLGVVPLVFVWGGANLMLNHRVEEDLASRASDRLRQVGAWARAEAHGRDLRLLGTAPSDAARAGAAAALRGVPGAHVVRNEATVIAARSPAALTAASRAGRAVVDGFAPPGLRARIAEAARAALGPEVATEGVGEGAEASSGFPDAAALAFRLLAGVRDGTVSLAEGQIVLRGAAADRAAYEAIRAEAARPPDGFAVDLSGLEPPRASPYRLVATRPGDRLRLEGHAPGETARRDALAAARLAAPDLAVEDALEVASGAPAGVSHSDAIRFAAGALARMEAGRVEIVDRRVSAEGGTADRDGAQALSRTLMGALPAGLEAGPVRVRTVPASPFGLRIRRGLGEVVLSGYLPDEATREAILAAARDLFLMERVVDRTRLAQGAPRDFRAAALAGLEAVAQTSGGEALLRDATLAVSGEVLYPQTAEQLRARLPRSGPPGWKVSAELTVPGHERIDRVACRRRVADLLTRDPVRFVAGAELQRRSYGVLDDVAEVLKSCPDAALDVIGLPEPQAPALERAQAVRDHLIRSGLPPERIGAQAGEGAPPGGDAAASGPVALRWR